MGKLLSIRLKDPQPPSFIVHLPGFPEIPGPYSWVAGSQVFSSFSASLGGWWDTFALVLCVPGHAPLRWLNLKLALLNILRIPNFCESLGILVQFFSLGSQQFFSLMGWAELLFSLFRKAQSLPTRGLGSLPIDFLINLGLALSLKAQMALRFQPFCIVLGFDTILWYFKPQQLLAQHRIRWCQRSSDQTVGTGS